MKGPGRELKQNMGAIYGSGVQPVMGAAAEVRVAVVASGLVSYGARARFKVHFEQEDLQSGSVSMYDQCRECPHINVMHMSDNPG